MAVMQLLITIWVWTLFGLVFIYLVLVPDHEGRTLLGAVCDGVRRRRRQ